MQASVVAARGLSSCGSRALERRLSSCGAQERHDGIKSLAIVDSFNLQPLSPPRRLEVRGWD